MASTYLTRTPASSGNRKTFSISFWVKRSKIGTSQFVYNARSTNASAIFFTSGDQLYFTVESGVIQLQTNRVFRDTSAWYHIVYKIDTTQATSSDRAKLYVNGVQETSFATETYPSQNADTRFNENVEHTIGQRIETDGDYFDGSLAHFHQTDGTAYDASTFGETDATTGIWKPKTAPSVTYGTNGFFLKFENSGAFGTDSSGNANNFTVNGTMTQTVDTPSNVFCTLNPLLNNNIKIGNKAILSLANTRASSDATSNRETGGTLGVSQGKWYFEAKLIQSDGTSDGIGFYNQDNKTEMLYRASPAFTYNGTDNYSYGTSYTAGDIIGVALDLDNTTISFYKNGTSQGNAKTDLPSGTHLPFVYLRESNAIWDCNFGNGYFGTVKVSTANSDTAGLGEFEYEVPDGYYSLCTKNINLLEYS